MTGATRLSRQPVVRFLFQAHRAEDRSCEHPSGGWL